METSFNENVFRCEKDRQHTSNGEMKVITKRVVQMRDSEIGEGDATAGT